MTNQNENTTVNLPEQSGMLTPEIDGADGNELTDSELGNIAGGANVAVGPFKPVTK
jgi:hypothetical protein